MKLKWALTGVGLLSIAAIVLLLRNPAPELVLKGTTGQVAKLELRNTTRNIMWLDFTYDKPPVISPAVTGQVVWGDLGQILTWKKVPSGGRLEVEVPAQVIDSSRRVGLYYYFASVSRWEKYLRSRSVSFNLRGPDWMIKLEERWYSKWKNFRFPEKREVWCKQEISFENHKN